MTEFCPPSQTSYPSDCEVREGLRTIARERSERSSSPNRQLLLEKGKNIKLLLLDVDGVLTDGSLLYGLNGSESKSFNTQDGFGLRLLHEAGIEAGVITARTSEIVSRRTTELKMCYVYQGVRNKNEAFRDILTASGRKPFEIAYMGDDWLDLVLLQQVGLAIAPANAVNEVKDSVHFVTERAGGSGAVREACDLLLEAHNAIAALLQKYKNR